MVEAFPLCWPRGYQRTPPGNRGMARFRTGSGKARDELLATHATAIVESRNILDNLQLKFGFGPKNAQRST